MGKPFMIQPYDEERIEALKGKLHIKTKIDVVRAGLDLLEKEVLQAERIERWKKAAKAVVATSKEINKDFQKYSRLKRF